MLALVAVTAPLFATLFSTLRTRTRAQATCVSLNSKLNQELGEDLRALIKLNPRARQLARWRKTAERVLNAALLSGTAPAVFAARGGLATVKGLQALLAIRQQAIRTRADLTRLRYRRELSHRARALGGKSARLSSPSARALAVVAKPPGRVAPEYVPARGFARRQAHTMRFTFPTLPNNEKASTLTTASCVVTLTKEKSRWRSKIIAASARSNSPYSRPRWLSF